MNGDDRARLLHALTTNHIQQLTPGAGCYVFFLNAQGRVLADANILCREDRLLLDTEPEIRERIHAHLDRYIIADDVTLDDTTARRRSGVDSRELGAEAGINRPTGKDSPAYLLSEKVLPLAQLWLHLNLQASKRALAIRLQ